MARLTQGPRSQSRPPTPRSSSEMHLEQQNAPVTESKKYRVIICVDLGTTFTSASYIRVEADRTTPPNGGSLKSTLEDTKVIKSFERGPGESECPTIMMYGPQGEISWGWNVKNAIRNGRVTAKHSIAELLKLSLHKSKETVHVQRQLDVVAKRVEKLSGGKPDFVRDFLRALHTNIRMHLIEIKGPNWWKEVCETEWVMCVPASWSAEEHTRLVVAAEAAGMQTPTLVSEAEAAAVVVLVEDEGLVSEHDTFIVCDAGGGTVDLTTYNVLQRSPLQLKETAVGESGLCGGSFLDKNFKDLILERIAGQNIPSEETDRAVREFSDPTDGIKKTFTGPDARTQRILIPSLQADPDKGLKRGYLYLTNQEISDKVFKPIVDKLRDMLKEQIRDSLQGVRANPVFHNRGAAPSQVKHIIMTGGLGYNIHIFNELRRTFEIDAAPENRISVIRAEVSKGIVARGGVLLALSAGEIITERRSRYSYGFDITRYYDATDKLHKTVDPVKDPHSSDMVVFEIETLVKRGQPVPQGFEFRTDRRERTVWVNETHLPVPDDLVVSDHSGERMLFEDAINRTARGNPKAREQFRILTDLSSIDWSKLKLFKHPKTRREYYLIEHYEIVMTITAVNTAAFEIVTHLPNGDVHRSKSFRPLRLNVHGLASLKGRTKSAAALPLQKAPPRKRASARKVANNALPTTTVAPTALMTAPPMVAGLTGPTTTTTTAAPKAGTKRKYTKRKAPPDPAGAASKPPAKRQRKSRARKKIAPEAQPAPPLPQPGCPPGAAPEAGREEAEAITLGPPPYLEKKRGPGRPRKKSSDFGSLVKATQPTRPSPTTTTTTKATQARPSPDILAPPHVTPLDVVPEDFNMEDYVLDLSALVDVGNKN